MQSSHPPARDIVLVGGGHAHALVLRRWGMDPLPGARLTVVNPGPVAPYTGMLPGAIAGHYAEAELMIDLVRLARFAGARLVMDRATGLDREGSAVLLASGRRLRFDAASLDIGIGSGLPDIPGYPQHGVSAKPLGAYAARWEAFVASAPQAPRVVVIGGGVGGIELALASAHRLRASGRAPQVTVIEREAQPLPGLGAATREGLLDACRSYGIEVRTGTRPARLEAGAVHLTNGTALPSDFTLAVAGSQPQGWLERTGLALHEGFVAVDEKLRSSDPRIFAAGDCAHLAHAPRPKAGVYAVRAAPVLFQNLRAAVGGGPFRAFRPQRDYLKLISLGERRAVADRSGLRAGGAWLWRVKDGIDRRFMETFDRYPAPSIPRLPEPRARGLAELLGQKPLCGGCGAKLGPLALQGALAGLPAPRRADVERGAGDDAAILRLGEARLAITTDHLRAFVLDPHLMARLAAVHALGDIWAMGGAPQAALAQVILPRAAEAIQADMLAEIMAAAAAVMAEAGAEIVGGHSSVGEELTVGFTVTGLCPRPVPKSGGRPGDALVLTKPLGTGVVLAAEMALARAPGRLTGADWAAAIASMTRPLGPAAARLAPEALAMTDVTGFGLAGHLWEMIAPAGLGARLDAGGIPVLPGAEALAARGIASTLMPANRAALDWLLDAPPGARTDLLFDPQTCGGLLAVVPAARAAALVEAIEGAAVIGHLTGGPARITLA